MDSLGRNSVEAEIAEIELRSRIWLDHSPVCTKIVDPDYNLRYMSRAGIGGLGVDDVKELYGESYPFEFYPKAFKEEMIGSMNEARETGERVEQEAPVTNLLGEEVWYHSSIVPVKNDKGDFEYFVIVSSDTTARITLEKQLRHSQKMDAIGQLTGGIAHDFNNVLGIIMGNLEILHLLTDGDANVLHRVDTALEVTKRGAELTRKLLNFSRIEARNSRLTSVNEFIQNLEEILIKTLTVSVKVEFHLADEPWTVKVDPGELQDAVVNLAINARDAMADGGALVIETANKVLDDEYVRRNPQSTAGEFVMLALSDTGEGMTPEVRDRVFEPFYTTKDQGKGSGLGLSMVYGFVQRSEGHMKIYSEPGEGTTVRIYLPRNRDQTDDIDIAPEKVELPRGDETILVVDDENHLVQTSVFLLESLGYKTLSACCGKDGLEAFDGNQKIDLLFSDVVMPGGMNGYELAEQALKKRPALKVLLASGFSKKQNEFSYNENDLQAGLSSNLLSKPYNFIELAHTVRRILDGTG